MKRDDIVRGRDGGGKEKEGQCRNRDVQFRPWHDAVTSGFDDDKVYGKVILVCDLQFCVKTFHAQTILDLTL